ncbi:MAG TPA: hypothetical protein VHW64_02185 [Nocardioides sp.]|jgi:hypothetical protein|uniref:hypothetical protein n=1 Tax=Nocardioides sp. TaxID=35761 RepID=UPI002E37E4FC|nr:hypothetical protein [Nocardioides sp.]HEX3929485.1 hypothetical protein [Nocardioides sp.]
MTRTTRGRLPARVYWVRRLMVLGIALLLVVGVAKLLSGGGGGSGGDSADRARQVADTSSEGGDPSDQGAHQGKRSSDDATPTRVVPSGPCAASDIAITPSVPHPVGGADITVALDVSSLATPACSWTLSSQTLAMKITSGADLIWTTAQCGHAIPAQDLVVRQGTATRVKVTWDARRSEPGCPVETAWALPGTYHLDVAALGGQPQETAFLLTAPSNDPTAGSTKHDSKSTKNTKNTKSTKDKKPKRHHKRPPG